jgi:formylglycine-generating enzyme required for sulfatase activity
VRSPPSPSPRFPVTNAEWRLFIAAGGYDDERWWEGEAAQDWRRGEGTGDGPKQHGARTGSGRDDPQRIGSCCAKAACIRRRPSEWEDTAMSEAEFEAHA